ncbi:MAG: glycerophosphodiester phosphodiesterase family protein [Spirochaetes bacterium]|nr:glycerophosphodiester phosphodiesterase family protein [Spirochaetota bacterium]
MRIPILPEFPRPLVFAHRGLSSIRPENTMASFTAAREAGIPGIELDVHLTADGKLAVFHDDTTGRIAGGGPGCGLKLETSDFAALAALDIGSWKGPEFSGERIPLLEEVFEEFGGNFYIDIEIKSRTTADMGLEALVLRAIEYSRMERRCLISSFNPFSLRRFKGLCPFIPTAIIWNRSEELYWFLRKGEGRWIGKVDILKPENVLVKDSRLKGAWRRPILPWTVDSDEEAERVFAAGALGIISNRAQDLSAWRKPAPKA